MLSFNSSCLLHVSNVLLCSLSGRLCCTCGFMWYVLHADVTVNLLTYLLTPWSRVLLEKLASLQLVKKFPAFFGTRRFLTALTTSARHLSLSWASPIQSSYPNRTSWRSILILSSHLRLGLPSGLFPSGFHTSTLYTPLPSPIRATCPAHLILLDFITRTILGDEYRPFSSSLCNRLAGINPTGQISSGERSLGKTKFFTFCVTPKIHDHFHKVPPLVRVHPPVLFL